MKEIQTIIGNTKAGIAIVGLMLITLVSSCSKGDDDSSEHQGTAGVVIGGVRAYAPCYEEKDNEATRTNVPYLAYSSLTRAWEKPTGYTAYESGDQPVAFALTKNDADPLMGYFFKSSGKWRAKILDNEDVAAGNYFLYGYVPHVASIEYNIAPNVNYSSGAIMTLNGVPSIMSSDLCVVIGAKDGTDAETVSSPGIRRGDFSYTAKAIDGTSGEGNYVFLLLDHLYSALKVNMCVDTKYAKLRTIKLKSLMLSTKVGETTCMDHTNITITLQANDGSSSPIVGDVSYVAAGKAIDVDNGGMEFWSDDSGQELTTSFQSFIGHFMPNGITTIILTSVYDVYDKNGNLIRKDCRATNAMVLKGLYSEDTVTEHGKRFSINMTIEPTYLYELSEKDLNNPGVKVN